VGKEYGRLVTSAATISVLPKSGGA
jgi:protein subunit release factor A